MLRQLFVKTRACIPQTLRKNRLIAMTGQTAVVGIPLFCAIHLVLDNVVAVHASAGPSMMPTLAISGDWVLENRFFLLGGHPRLSRGDLIVYVSPANPENLVCKRILGLPGDVVTVDPTGEYAPLQEHVVVPKGHVWTMGDNAAWSRDSRTYGPVSIALIRGKVVARIWPLHRFTIYRSPITRLN